MKNSRPNETSEIVNYPISLNLIARDLRQWKLKLYSRLWWRQIKQINEFKTKWVRLIESWPKARNLMTIRIIISELFSRPGMLRLVTPLLTCPTMDSLLILACFLDLKIWCRGSRGEADWKVKWQTTNRNSMIMSRLWNRLKHHTCLNQASITTACPRINH